MKKILIVLLLCLVLAGCQKTELMESNTESSGVDPSIFKCPDCNVILITIDSLRVDHVGTYGYKYNTTPNLDKWAENSLVFENAYSPAPHTIPAFQAIMTGKPVSNDNRDEIIAFYEKTTFLGKLMQEKGYLTAAITDHGGLGGESPNGSFSATPIKGFEIFKSYAPESSSRKLTEESINWLRSNKNEKFFLWVHYFGPHYPYIAVPEYAHMFGFSNNSCGRIYNGMGNNEMNAIRASLTAQELNCIISLYDARIYNTDKNVGLLLDEIKNLNLTNNSMIIIFADHGDEFNEKGRLFHGDSVYNSLLHVPLIVRNPYQALPSRIDGNIATQNFFDIISNIDSENIEFENEIFSRKYPFYRTDKYYDFSGDFVGKYSIISGDYKFVYEPGYNVEELFNIKKDPAEANNIYFSPERSKLKEKLVAWIKDKKAESSKPSENAIKEQKETEERMKSLGYLN